nr:amidase domain-containing protein [Nocardia bovistercoris]
MRRWIVLLVVVSSATLVGSQGTANAGPAYDGAAAARWALGHAQDQQPDIAGCTWFASQALWAGGMPKDETWNDKTISGLMVHGVAGSRAATLADELYRYLLFHTQTLPIPLAGPHAQSGQDRFATNAVPEARLGDLIAYDWDGDDVIDHMSVVTHIGKNNYPDVSEWGTAKDGRRSDYVYRGWTWSENDKNWLRVKNPHVIATLLVVAP